jgi:hypothetical protein
MKSTGPDWSIEVRSFQPKSLGKYFSPFNLIFDRIAGKIP